MIFELTEKIISDLLFLQRALVSVSKKTQRKFQAIKIGSTSSNFQIRDQTRKRDVTASLQVTTKLTQTFGLQTTSCRKLYNSFDE